MGSRPLIDAEVTRATYYADNVGVGAAGGKKNYPTQKQEMKHHDADPLKEMREIIR